MTPALRHCRGDDLDAPTLYRLLRLRVDVFVVEQSCPYPELDGRDMDPQARHFWLEGPAGEVISTLRLIEEDSQGHQLFRIGRVCTASDARGRGNSTRLIQAALAEVGEHPCRISAQSYLADMYARHGFVADGEQFSEDGIAHIPMLRVRR